jgi:hypothetical protein
MNPSPIAGVPVPVGAGPTGILLSIDLIFTSKVTGTARELGHRVLVAGTSSLALAMIGECSPCVVFVDLAAGDLVAPTALVAYQGLAGPATAFVAFGPHVDTDALAAARAAGCDLVIPRSRFSAGLTELLERYFQGDRSRGSLKNS